MSYPRLYGPYTLLERLGHGGMSEVDLARQAVVDANYVRLLVIKRLRPDMASEPHFVRMFQDEARINTELQHANIVQIYNFGAIGEEYFLAMEYIAGTDLRAVQRAAIARQESFPLRATLRVLSDVLSALDYAHRRVDTFGRPMKVIHRDVNPRNIMLSVRGEVKLIDFGVAKADTRFEQTVSHALKGKFAYMSPEQIEGDRPLDGRSDLYAIGLILHELLTGASPFAGLNDIQTMHRILAGKIPPLTFPTNHPIPDALSALHRQSIAKDPEQRYPDAATMRQAVLSAAEALGGVATNAEMADLVLRLMPGHDRDRLDRLSQYQETDSLNVPELQRDEQGETIVDALLGDDTLTNSTVNTTSSVLQEARTASRPILLGFIAGVVVLLSVGVAIWATEAFILTPQRPPTRILPSVPTLDETPPEAQEPAPVEFPSEPPPTAEERPPRNPVAPGQTPPPPAADVEERPPKASPPASPPAEPSPASPEPAPSQEDVPVEFGYVFVTSTPTKGLPVFIDGVRVGYTPLTRHSLPVGNHLIEVRDPQSGTSSRETISINVGRSRRVTFNQ